MLSHNAKPAEKTAERHLADCIRDFEEDAEQVGAQVVAGVRKEVSRWPAIVALLVIGGINASLSERLTVGPGWLLLPVLILLIIPAVISRLVGNHQLNHSLVLLIIGLVTFTELSSISLLLLALPDKSITAVSLLRDAGLLWGSNVIVFALWYWQVDGGGPYARSHESCQDYHQNSELLFPQLGLVGDRPRLALWRPSFTDYLFVAFNTSTAFSPTDTAVLSSRIKWLTMTQAVLSLVTLAALAARAINIL